MDDIENSELEKWLREKNMHASTFANLMQVSRPTIWKVKRGLPICPHLAKRIFDFTEGRVKPVEGNPIGRPRL